MIALVGYTGFVGSNIYAAAGGKIGAVYNSKNIREAYGTNPDLLIYAGLRAEKYLADHNREKDMGLIIQAEENIKVLVKKSVGNFLNQQQLPITDIFYAVPIAFLSDCAQG